MVDLIRMSTADEAALALIGSLTFATKVRTCWCVRVFFVFALVSVQCTSDICDGSQAESAHIIVRALQVLAAMNTRMQGAAEPSA
jgi:hypothetical protein